VIHETGPVSGETGPFYSFAFGSSARQTGGFLIDLCTTMRRMSHLLGDKRLRYAAES
jgi:hypothetical protein